MFFKSQEKFSSAQALGWTGFGWDILALLILSGFLLRLLFSTISAIEALWSAAAALGVAVAFRRAGRQTREHTLDDLENLPAFVENAMARKAYTHSPRHGGNERRRLAEDAIHLGARLVERREALKWQIRDRAICSRIIGSLFLLLAVGLSYASLQYLPASGRAELSPAAAAPLAAAIYAVLTGIEMTVSVPRTLQGGLHLYHEVKGSELLADYFEQEASDRQMADRALLAVGDRVLSGAGRDALRALDAQWRDRIKHQAIEETDPRWAIKPPPVLP